MRKGTLRGMERLTRAEVQCFSEACPGIFGVWEAVLGGIFDEQGGAWTDLKLRLGAAMSAVELASNSKLQVRRAMWHCAMVLMSLQDAVPSSHDAWPLVSSLAGVANAVSRTAMACDSEVASEDSVRDARSFIAVLGDRPPTWERLQSAWRAVS